MNLATMRDVASLAGVSTATVSHVVNGTKKISPETVEKVLMAISKVNYQPNTVAKSLRMGQTHTIGVLVEDIRGLPVASIVSGISETLSRNGFFTIFICLKNCITNTNRSEHTGNASIRDFPCCNPPMWTGSSMWLCTTAIWIICWIRWTNLWCLHILTELKMTPM